jgi:hypothetical protein
MTRAKRTIEEIIFLIADYFSQKSVEYVIIGGIAVIAWGRPRTTQDIDIIVSHKDLDVQDFANFFRSNDFFVDAEGLRSAFAERAHATILDKQSLLRIDLKGAYSASEQDSLTHRRKQQFHDHFIFIDSPENLIAHKLLFGSEQDFQDALAVFARTEEILDTERLNKMISSLGVEKEFSLLEKIIKDYREEKESD